jgi:hypothetical protein
MLATIGVKYYHSHQTKVRRPRADEVIEYGAMSVLVPICDIIRGFSDVRYGRSSRLGNAVSRCPSKMIDRDVTCVGG